MTITMIFGLILSMIIGGGLGYFLNRSIYEYAVTENKSPMIVAIITIVAWLIFIVIH